MVCDALYKGRHSYHYCAIDLQGTLLASRKERQSKIVTEVGIELWEIMGHLHWKRVGEYESI